METDLRLEPLLGDKLPLHFQEEIWGHTTLMNTLKRKDNSSYQGIENSTKNL